MKLTEIIPKQGLIVSSKPQFFIAECNFDYNGLPILKDSLIYFDGKNKVKVNQFIFGIFQERNVPNLISHQLPEDEEYNYIVDKFSSCQYEITKLPSGLSGTWHIDHFHITPSTIDRLPDLENIVKQTTDLKFSNISFSSLYYTYDANTNSLTSFISTKPFELTVKDKTIRLPEFIEVGQNEGANKDLYFLRPLFKMDYFGVSFEGDCRIDENGVFYGSCAKEFSAEIFGNSEINKIVISKGFDVAISSDGVMEIELFNEKIHQIEKYKIRKCQA